MTDPKIRYSWWHLNDDGTWSECSGCSDARCQRGYGVKLQSYFNWLVYSTRQEALQRVYRFAYNSAFHCGQDFEPALRSAQRVLQHLTIEDARKEEQQ